MENDVRVKRRHQRGDFLLIFVLLLFILLGAIYLYCLRPVGSFVCITVDGEFYGNYSLSQDRVEEIITGKNRDELNRVVISDGKVFVQEASCPDGICKNYRPIFRDGESIICLPHRVVITVESENSVDAPDAVA